MLVHRQAEELEQIDREDVVFSDDIHQPIPSSNNLLFYPMISGLLSFAGTFYYLVMFKKKKVKIIENVLVVVVLITYLKVNLDKNSTNIDFYYYI